MATTTSRTAQRRHVHVHGAEVSTDGESIGGYAEAIALIVAIVAVIASAWVAMAPGEGADFVQPATPTPPQQLAGDFVLAPQGTAVQPDPDGPQEVAVVRPGSTGSATFGDPFGVAAEPAAADAG